MKHSIEKSKYFLFFLFALIQLVVWVPVQAEFIADGVILTPLTDDGKSRAVSWAYHGDLICIAREETSTQRQLLIMNSDGSSEQAVTQIGNPFFAEWSWNGKKLSYEFSNADNGQSQAGVFIYDVASKKSISISAPYPRDDIDSRHGPYWSADDRYVAYTIRPGTTGKSQVWVANAQTGKHWRILAERGEVQEQRWNPTVPPKICLRVEASGGGFDAATVNPEGKDFILLTDIGAQSVDVDNPRWSPTGEWIALTSNIDMTQSEREYGRERMEPGRSDCFISRPDGTETRNLTNASSPATEEQLEVGNPIWSWDGRWILGDGERFDNQGNDIDTIYLVDPINGGYEAIITTYPREVGETTFFRSIKWSYDSTKIALLSHRFVVKNWGPDSQFENPRWVLSIYDIQKRSLEDILIYNEQLDRKQIVAGSFRFRLGGISWSPDNRSILLSIGTIISLDDDIVKPDVYRLDLPQRLIAATASQHIGPSMGRDTSIAYLATELTQVEQADAAEQPSDDWEQVQITKEGFVTKTLKPMHMTVEEAVESLPLGYGQYFTLNPVRNTMLFKGPSEVLSKLHNDLQLIDTPAPHILVDLLAVELSDEANQKLGLDWTYTDGHFGFFQPAGRGIQQFGHVGTEEDYRVGFPSGALDELSTLPGVGQSFYQGVGTLPREFFIRLNTLVKDGEGTILANPRNVAMSGKESLINIRKTLNYFYDEGFDVAGRPIVRKSDISADTEGRIVPTLLADGTIHLTVDIQVGNYTFTPDAGLPELTTRQSTTEVTVQEGQTLVLGGLRQQEMSSSITKVPILGDLPLVGALFKHEEMETEHSVLTIFITPHILEPNGPAPEWPQLNPEEHKLVPIMKEPNQTKEE